MRPREILKALIFFAQGVKNSIHADSSDNYLELKGDQDTPGATMYYGTNAGGVKGWNALPSATVADGSVTNVKLANEAQSTIKGRAAGAGTGVPQDLTPTQVKNLLAITGADISITASQVTNVPAGNIGSTTVQGALNELDSEKQPVDADLTAIAAISPANNDIIQRKTGVWTNRTPAQFKTDLTLSKTDVGLSNVDNTSDVNKPVSTAQAVADALHVLKAGDTMSGNLAMGGNKVTGVAAGAATGEVAIFDQLPLSKLINIGTWNMQTTGFVTISHGLTLSKITSWSIIIISDSGTYYNLLSGDGASTNLQGGALFGTTLITISRPFGSQFNSGSFTGSSNRGTVLITYTA